MTAMTTHHDSDVLDNPMWASLSGPHAHFADRNGRAARFRTDVSVFSALADPDDPRAWADLAELAGPGAVVVLAGAPVGAVPGWEIVKDELGVQLVDTAVTATADPQAVPLGLDDVPEILDLVRRTKPGPFLARTVALGTYLGIRRGGRLVAMAGTRLHPPGWTEISAVCTDPAHRGEGLATRLVRAVAADIRARSRTPFMHALSTNTSAIQLYESIGFAHRRTVPFLQLRTPGEAA
jgi:ribosomal protein S18 acetylase RimI-like enzyme